MADLITYEAIYGILRKEKYEPELQVLNPNFFGDVINYLKEKKSIVNSQKSQDSIFSKEAEKTEKQLGNIMKIIRELYDKRENKIVQLSLFTARTGILAENPRFLKEEEEFYNSLVNLFKVYRKGILENILLTKEPVVSKVRDVKKESSDKTKLVRFLDPVPKFMGEDLNIYGPFNAEDIANLPPRVSRILISKKKVKEIKS